MNKKLLAGVIFLISLSCWADDENFPAGTLIIPMDKETQNLANDGIFLAYGLVFELLGQGYTVYAAINPNKENLSKDAPDIFFEPGQEASEYVTVANGSTYMPYKVAGESDATTLNKLEDVYLSTYNISSPLLYRGGPYIIHSENADAVKAFMADNPKYNAVVIHEFKNSITIPIGITYDEVPKKIALLASTVNGVDYTHDVLECYLALAGFSPEYYDILSQEEISGGQLIVGTYYILWMPHWDLLDQSDLGLATSTLDRINEFLDAGGNVLSTCRAIDSMESHLDLLAETNLAVNEKEADLQPAAALYNHHDIPFAQIGNYQFEVDAQDNQIFRPFQSGDAELAHSNTATVSKWLSNAQIVAYKYDPSVDINNPGSSQEDKWAYYAMREKDDDDNKGNIHYIAGHQYASCKPTILPGSVYSFSTTMSDCEKGKSKTNFWSQPAPCIRVTLHYSTGDKSITIELCKDEVRNFVPDENTLVGEYEGMTIGNEFMLWAEAPDENPDRFGVNYGPGCQGGGSAQGTDHMSSVYLQNLTADSNIIIQNITVEWTCNGFAGGTTGGGCGTTYQFEQFDIRILDKENGANNCGRTSCDDCGNVYNDGKICYADGEVTFEPEPKKGGDLTFDGGEITGTDGQPIDGNVGGLRYIYNTLFNKIKNPINVAEFSRSGAVVKKMNLTGEDKTYVFFGTFEFPGNAGHYRAYEAVGTKTDLKLVWDTQDKVPAYLERDLYTYIDGNKIQITSTNASKIHSYLQSPTLTENDVAENINSFLGKYRLKRLGGIERSTSAIVTPNKRVNPDRKPVAFVGTTYGALTIIDLADGSELGGYVPPAVLPNFDSTGVDDSNRPKVDSSPTVLDAFLPTGSGTERAWKTVLLVGNGSGAGGFSCLDVSDPEKFTLMWDKTSTIVPDPTNPPAGAVYYGNIHRVSVARYKEVIGTDEQTGFDLYGLGYAAVAASNIPNGHGMNIAAYDLKEGTSLPWAKNPIQIDYVSPVNAINDIPAPPAIFDSNSDNFDDTLLVGDMAGTLWSVDLTTGVSKSLDSSLAGTLPSTEVRPIGASPTVGELNGKTVIAYGTGGSNWSNATNNYVRVLEYSTGTELLTIDIGKKRLFSPVIITDNQLFFTAIDGTLGSADPTLDIETVDEESEIHRVTTTVTDGVFTFSDEKNTIAKSESSLYVNQGQTYTSSFEGEVERHGEQKEFSASQLFKFLLWHDLNNKPTEKVSTTTPPVETTPKK